MRYRFDFQCSKCDEQWETEAEHTGECWDECPNCGEDTCAATYWNELEQEAD